VAARHRGAAGAAQPELRGCLRHLHHVFPRHALKQRALRRETLSLSAPRVEWHDAVGLGKLMGATVSRGQQ
jgi:hypothetical protein